VSQTRLFIGVVLVEILVITALWVFGWYFGA
jgi:hypothetical protein